MCSNTPFPFDEEGFFGLNHLIGCGVWADQIPSGDSRLELQAAMDQTRSFNKTEQQTQSCFINLHTWSPCQEGDKSKTSKEHLQMKAVFLFQRFH